MRAWAGSVDSGRVGGEELMGKVHYLTRGTRDPRGVPTSTRSRSVSTIPLTCITSVIGYVSNKHPNCYIWQSRYFEEGSHVVLGTMYRKVKIVGSYEVGRNYIMMRLDEVGGFLKFK